MKRNGESYKGESGGEHEEIDSIISDINSMVVNLSTSSVPNISELGIDSSKAISPLRDRFKLIKDSPLSHSCQADLQFAGINNSSRMNVALKPSAKQEETEVKEKQPKRKRWSLNVDPTTYQWLVIPAGMDLQYTYLYKSQTFSAVHHSEMAQKHGKNKKKIKGYMVTYIALK